MLFDRIKKHTNEIDICAIYWQVYAKFDEHTTLSEYIPLVQEDLYYPNNNHRPHN